MQNSIIKTLALLLLSIALSFAEYAPNISTDTRLDQLIYRLSSRYGIAVPDGMSSRPVNYGALYRFFSAADTLSVNGKLSELEKCDLELAEKTYGFTRNKLRWHSRKSDISLKGDLELLGDIAAKHNEYSDAALKGIISPSLKGNIGKLSFYSGIDVWTEYRSDTIFKRSSYQPYDGIPYNVYGRSTEETDIRSSDIPFGGIVYNTGRGITLETAIDRLRYGPAVYYPLTLSGLTPPITYARATLDMEIINYSHSAGLLKSQKDLDKYIYTHRLAFKLFRSRLQAGINEVIVTGTSTHQDLGERNTINPADTGKERGWEWAYLIPFVPFKFVEHYAGDRDNAALSADFTLWYPQKFRWYGEFYLDDMLSPWKLLSSDWGNKWALTLGAQYFGDLSGKDLTIGIEYSHVEPWVYTHFFGGSHNYMHFGQCLGNPLGPNSQGITLSAETRLTRAHSVTIGFTSIAKNSSVRGGNITDVFQFESAEDSTAFRDSETKEFLGDGTVWKSIPSIKWSFFPSKFFNMQLEYSMEIVKDDLTNKVALWGGLHF